MNKIRYGSIFLIGTLVLVGCKRADSESTADSTSDAGDFEKGLKGIAPTVTGQIKTIEETTSDGKRVVMQVKIGADGKEIRHGLFTAYYPNGNKWGESHFKDDVQDGKFTEWFSTGVKKREGQYDAGKPDGLWTEWDRNGNQIKQTTFVAGKPVSATPTTAAPTSAPTSVSAPPPTTQPASP